VEDQKCRNVYSIRGCRAWKRHSAGHFHGISAEFGRTQHLQWDKFGITRSIDLSTFGATNKPTSSICASRFVGVCKKLSRRVLTRKRAIKRIELRRPRQR